uniref:DNA-directed DNA polymerase n=1 Tax=viral metagenome TaxID=1070528 RepID=A0A6C0IF28_9ZZZZ
MDYNFRIFDFNIFNEKKSNGSSYDEDGNIIESDEEEVKSYKDNAKFMIQMFGVDETGKTCSIMVEEFKPFFYVMVNDTWSKKHKDDFLSHIKQKIGKYYEDSITDCIIIKRKKLYGFDGGKEHKFVKFEFNNIGAFNKAKNIWYTDYNKGHTLITDREGKVGYVFNNTHTVLYEANIPPLLRFFHIQDISPSGWVALPKKKTILVSQNLEKKTNCDYEFVINCKDIIPLNNKETRVPYKICSFDIEASSSHGDFPVPIKSYKKLTTNIIEYFENLTIHDLTPEICKNMLRNIILNAFGYDQPDNDIKQAIDKVYPKKMPPKAEVVKLCEKWLSSEVRTMAKQSEFSEITTIESLFEKMEEDNEDEFSEFKKYVKSYTDKKATIADIICDKKFERDGKINEINISLNATFPRLEGDKCTFIGSTFMNYGEQEPYFNHCIVLNTCTEMPIDNSVVESYNTEKEVLLAWQQLIQRENPDIIIGYNIFGFDYEFMFRRAEENNCVQEFLKLSRNKDEICANYDKETNRYKIEESSIQIASGQHDLKFIKINGRLQVDLYNFFRREENLTSYKLDYVAGHFIGDYVKSFEHIKKENVENGETLIKTTNMTGLLEGSFIHIEEIGHSVDYYEEGAKFKVTYVNKTEGKFIIDRIISPDTTKKVRWCLAKDDVTPKDIFRMTNGTANDRSVIAKYCIQDCNLVHYLFNKADILTGFVEMAKICSVPINFLVMRGQGIKLTSYIAKKCREKRTLMPVIEKGSMDDGYEGAIVLEPKCDLYLDNPVACVDYASLYPSSMISENLSHDSKVWTKEYDLAGNLIEEYGDKDPATGEFIYDNLPGFEYVNVTYDTYRYIRKTPSSAAEKVKSGTKICRFAQPGESGEGKAIMPSILEELLMARKTTRKLIPLETDEFMKNVLDKRQIGYKLTANSLYGQCGAKTSTFYEKDIAACTTATGRLLLTYAKKIIEECYGDSICNTEHYGKVKTNAEYIYGDTDSVFFTFNLQTLEGEPIRGKQALEITIELAQEAGHLASSFLKGPHDLEYEKTFMPFCLLSKKRYVGMLYETDPNKCKRKEMGIVLKRRDNAPIVKDIYGGIIDILMKQQNIKQASDFLKSCLQNIVDEKYPIDKLIITKSLRSGYKNPKSIAHKVLADRITARDPGNKPSSGDRIPFVYINTSNKKALQGEKIETPAYIIENNLKIDYSFYITNQIMKPVQQVFALVLEKIWAMQSKTPKIIKFKRDVEALRKTVEHDKFDDKLEQLKNKEVKALLFDEYLRETNNEKEGNQSLTKFFKK